MRLRVFIAVLIVGVLLALLPPFFTHGTCTAEFDAVTDAYQGRREEFATLARAEAYLQSHSLRYLQLSNERCERWPARDVLVCPGGPVLLVALPVQDPICRYYRDRSVRLQLGFNPHEQLVRIQTDMHPYQILRLPLLQFELDWAR